MSLEQDIRAEIENIKKLKMEVGYINNHLSILEGLCREDKQKQIDAAYQRGLSETSSSDYQHGYEDGYKNCLAENDFDQPCTNCDKYKQGLNDAWEAARKIVTWPDRSLVNSDTFDLDPGENIFTKYSASEAIAKLKAYEDKQKDSIEVGDEVIDRDGDITIVTNIHERLFDGLCNDGSTMGDLFLEDVRKTGRHFDQIDKLLEAMRK